MHIIMIPSVSGGIGHIARTTILARTLIRLDPATTVEYVLDTERLRPFNIDAATRTGFRVNLLPPRPRETRDAIVREMLGHADVIIDDTSRYLLPLRQIVPQAAWVSIPLFPVGDELFMDWPFMVQMDGIIWAYSSVMEMPPELAMVEHKVVQTGPFLDLSDVPQKEEARARFGFAPDEVVVVYAPRGMPFGYDFGQRVLSSVYGAVEALRAAGKKARLVLLAVRDLNEIRVPGVPAELPEWVDVVGLVTPAESLVYTRAANIVIAEGTSTAHEAAAVRTPLVMIPGLIKETWLLGTRLHENDAAQVVWIEAVSPESLAHTFTTIVDKAHQTTPMLDRAYAIVTGGGGVEAAAHEVLRIAAEHKGR